MVDALSTSARPPPAPTDRWTGRLRTAFWVYGGLALAVSVWMALRGGAGIAVLDTMDLQYLTVGALAAAACARAMTRSRGPSARVWGLISVAMAFYVVADLAFVVADAAGEVPWVSPIDLLYLATYAALFAAIWSLGRARSPREGPRALLDGLVLAAGLGVLAWELVIVAPGGMASAEGVGARVVLVAYPMLDMVLLGAGVGLLLLQGHRPVALRLFVGFLVLFQVADVTYAVISYTAEEQLLWVDATFLAAYLLLGSAALCKDAPLIAERQPDRPPGLWRFALLTLAVLVPGFAASATQAIGGGVSTALVVGISLAIGLVLCVRVAGVLHTQARDHAAAQSMREELRRRALVDDLTGLPNRAALLSGVGEDADGSPLALLFIDLDRFKVVNDTAGHHVGDRVLYDAAARIASAVREGDLVHRLAGDEFVVLCPGVTDVGTAERIAESVLLAMKPAFRVGRLEWFVGASVGIALGTPSDSFDAERLLNAGDIAMYEAKRDATTQLATFDQSMERRLRARHRIEVQLRRAVEDDRIEPAFQPVVTLADRSVVGFEALARWRRDDGSVVDAAEFIVAAEQTGLLETIDREMLRRAARFVKARNEARLDRPPVFVSVNLSPLALACDVSRIIERTIDEVGMDPTWLVMELTEGAAVTEFESAVRRLTAIRDLGVHLAIDDFGTGFSSLAHLLRFPADYLKVDRLFIEALGEAPDRRSGAAAALRVSETLGLRAVAEAVETPAQAEALRRLGYEYAQGYLFSRPMSETEALRWEPIAADVPRS